jgi:hypothetical protein
MCPEIDRLYFRMFLLVHGCLTTLSVWRLYISTEDNYCREVGGMRIGRGNSSVPRKPVPVPPSCTVSCSRSHESDENVSTRYNQSCWKLQTLAPSADWNRNSALRIGPWLDYVTQGQWAEVNRIKRSHIRGAISSKGAERLCWRKFLNTWHQYRRQLLNVSPGTCVSLSHTTDFSWNMYGLMGEKKKKKRDMR